MIRAGEWKLIHYHEEGHDELYNLDSDPGERNDGSTDNRTKASELRRRLDSWPVEVDATFPVPDPRYDPEKESARLRELQSEWTPVAEDIPATPLLNTHFTTMPLNGSGHYRVRILE